MNTKKEKKPSKITKDDTLNSNPKVRQKPNYQILFAISFIIISFILSGLYYTSLPNSIITHWGLMGNPDGYAPKEIGLFIVPILSIGILILLYFIPKIDPLQKNIDEFRKEYHTLIAVISAFFLYLQLIIITLNLGINIDIRTLLIPAFAVLIYSTGTLIRKTKRNFFIGIRTPWTISSDYVWEKTHKKAGQLFKASAILCLVGYIVPELAFFFIIVPLLLTSLGIIIYSYIEYKKEIKSKK